MLDKNAPIIAFFKTHRYLIIVVLFIILLAHGYSLVIADDLSVDDENFFRTATADRASMWITSGRYGISAFNLLLLPVFDNLPFFNLLMAVGLMGISALLFCYFISRILKSIKIPKLGYAFLAATIVCFPSVLDALSFNCINIQVAIATNLSLLGTYFITRWIFEKQKAGLAILGILLSWFSMTVFQSFAGAHIALVVMFSFCYLLEMSFSNQVLRFKNLLRIIGLHIVAFLIPLLLYYAGSYLVRTITGLKSNGYAESLMQMHSPREIAFNVWYNLKTILFGDRIIGIESAKYLILTFILSQFSLLFVKNIKNKAWIIVFAFILVAAPFALSVIRAGIAIRALTALPFMIGFCGLMTITITMYWLERVPNKKIRETATVLLVIVSFLVNYFYFYSDNLYYYASHIRYTRDETIARSIAEDVIDLTGEDAPDKPVVLIGVYQIRPMENGLTHGFGGSLFDFDIEFIRGIYLMNYLGYQFTAPSHEFYETCLPYADEMPEWPAEGSIVEYDDAIVVKLSE